MAVVDAERIIKAHGMGGKQPELVLKYGMVSYVRNVRLFGNNLSIKSIYVDFEEYQVNSCCKTKSKQNLSKRTRREKKRNKKEKKKKDEQHPF
jgi:hypothetical protein